MTDVGVIITNRDRSDPLDACLASLSAQTEPPDWVVLSDLSSSERHRVALTALAASYQISYLRIEHQGEWNKSLAFNTALRRATRAFVRR
jgi:GT2 family glycosyltransferase